MKMIIRFMHK